MSRQTGTVAKWLNHRGIGFITPTGQESQIGTDLLVHYTNIKQETEDGFKSLAEGSTVEYETTVDPKNPDKMIAINVTGVGGADCEKRPRGGRRRFDEANKEFQLYVGNLNPDTTWRELKDHFRQVGTVDRADVNSKSHFGLVRFTNAEDTQQAIDTLNGVELSGHALEVRRDNKAE
mmetsp:Transcript_3604/g.8198  ORF Transcript_3604/g.8198 Transcript_3604/m.8198 type:complete len:177 (-) Transcript_3604:362-892(-)